MNGVLTYSEIERAEKAPFLFVMGKGRSGTTLFQSFLNAHPNIVAPPESRFIMLLYKRYGQLRKWTERQIASFCDDLFKETLFTQFWVVDKEKLKASMLEAKERLSYQLACKMVFCHQAPEGKDIKLFSDKNPHYFLFTSQIDKLFPDAKYIHIVRDYRPNIESHKKLGSVNLSAADIAYRWLLINKHLEEVKSKAPDRWYSLKYENLVSNPSACMQEVCSFLDLPYNNKMIEKQQENFYPEFYENKATERFKSLHGKLFQPISDANLDEWKNSMPAQDLKDAEAIAGNYGQKMYGYKLTSNKVKPGMSPIRVFKVEVKGKILLAFFRIIMLNWPVFLAFRALQTKIRGKKNVRTKILT